MPEKTAIIFTSHARYQLKERGLNQKEVIVALTNSERTIKQTDNRYRALTTITQDDKKYVWVVIYEKHNSIIEIITAFLTSKIKKYLQL